MNVRIYRRASTEGQHADRALASFARILRKAKTGRLPENTLRMQVARLERGGTNASSKKHNPAICFFIEAIDRLNVLSMKNGLNSKPRWTVKDWLFINGFANKLADGWRNVR